MLVAFTQKIMSSPIFPSPNAFVVLSLALMLQFQLE
jgi:hypothetical protein